MRPTYKLSTLSRWISLALATLAVPLSQSVWGAESGASVAVVELPEVLVTSQRESTEGSAESGYRNTTAAVGPLGRLPLQDTPYSLNVTSGELFENRSAHTVSDALKTNPTVSTLMESNGYSSMSRVMVRGFTAADQDFRDGLVDRSFTVVPLENVERIEVLNGLSSFLNGFAALGGSVDYVSKQPTDTPYASIAAGQYGGDVNYLHGDAGGRMGGDDRWGYRVNAYGEDGRTYIDGSKQQRGLISGVLDFKPNRDTRFWLDAWHQDLDMSGLITYINVNPAGGVFVPDASRFSANTQYGQDWSYNKSEKTLVGAGVESALNDTFTFRAAYRHGDMWRDYQFVGATLTDNAGHYSEKATGSTRQTEQTHSAYALLDAAFHTGTVGHKLTFGYSGTDFLYTRGDDVFATLGNSSIGDPVSYANPGLAIGPTNVWYQQHYTNWVLGDRMALNDAWSALVGGSRASIDLDRWGSGTALSAQNYSQSKITPSFALLYKPRPEATLYVSYMEGLVNGGTAPSAAANANQILAPSISAQYELGAKANLDRMDLTAALFRIDKVNEYTDPTDNLYKQDGREIHQGLEFTASGKLTDRLTLVGGFTVQDAHVAQAKNNTALEGKTPVNVPEQQARLYLEYALPSMAGLTVIGGANYSGKRPVDSANTDYLDGATTFDAGVRYQTRLSGHPLTLNLNVGNLFDKAYWSYYRSGDGLALGAPRVVSFTLKAEL
jgi:iron complex outermembrane receptor protein